jgi:hypothetical protein
VLVAQAQPHPRLEGQLLILEVQDQTAVAEQDHYTAAVPLMVMAAVVTLVAAELAD